MNILSSSSQAFCSEVAGLQVYRVQNGPIIAIDGAAADSAIILISEKSGLRNLADSKERIILCPSHLAIGSLDCFSSCRSERVHLLSPYETYCHDLGNGCKYCFSPIPCTNILMVFSWKLEIFYDLPLLPTRCIEGYLPEPIDTNDETTTNLSTEGQDMKKSVAPTRFPMLVPFIYLLGANGCNEIFLERAVPRDIQCSILVPMWCASMVDRNRANLILRHTVDQVADTIKSACLSGSRILMIADRPLETFLVLGEYILQIFRSLPNNYLRALTVIDNTNSMPRFREAYRAVHSRVSGLSNNASGSSFDWFFNLEFAQLSAPVLYDARHQQNFSCFLLHDGPSVRDALQHVTELAPAEALNTRPVVDVELADPNGTKLMELLNILGDRGDTVIIDFLEAGKMGPRKHYKQFKMTNHEVLHTNAFEPPPAGSKMCLEYVQGTHNLNEISQPNYMAPAPVGDIWYSRRNGNKVLIGQGASLADYCLPPNIEELIAVPSLQNCDNLRKASTAEQSAQQQHSITMTNMFDLKLLLADPPQTE